MVAGARRKSSLSNPRTLFQSGPYPTALNELGGTNYATWAEAIAANGGSETDSGIPSWHGINTPALRRYEFNGVLHPTGNHNDLTLALEEVIPGAVSFWSLEGKRKIGFPDPYETREITEQITDEDLLSTPKVVFDTDGRLNQIEVRFVSTLLDGAPDVVVYPPPNSQLAENLLDEDGGRLLTDSVTLEGSNNPFHATGWAADYLLQSRRPLYQFTMGRRGFLYEPGDLVELTSEQAGINTVIKIETVRPNQNFRVDIEASEYHDVDYLLSLIHI